ncbi:UDP-N-acetylmuramate--L-alanine ligase [Formicincola oecophyllae]|uniref:UDP-N-acetylmuramate--L-alanine ligase n=1 Tax=Formicincola oecophyllae TaxID=2558361 RepID=A0A4Y6U7M3_9PROT|nr:UDP-N-acetylmuramate--L-alanine ligase [Formicincola oecophyllae]QDH13010.1 UDP-N-acetylmuramate--L-alanine ligase [Formicincola oecophyllae]
MRANPLNVGTIHFIGIGGIGMSGIAEVLHMLGYNVQGSDMSDSANVQRLRKLGIKVHVGHDAAHLGDAAVVVVSSAVKADNPEVREARHRLVPVVRRAEMLAELMRLRWSVAIGGTHGKTTTTSLVACILEEANLDPTVINGGIIEAYGTNARMGRGNWMVAEADESDGSFLRLPAVIAVVTNMDPEHLEHWGSEEGMEEGYRKFISNVPFYGCAVLCIDHPRVQKMLPHLSEHRLITYGFSPQADIQPIDLVTGSHGARFSCLVKDRVKGTETTIGPFTLPMFGKHNVLNALAAISVATQMNIEPEATIRGLAGFGGVQRRFTRTGTWNGCQVIDDYGHHPVEIKAVLQAARQAGAKRLVAVVQPHRYTRLRDLFDDFSTAFNDADTVVVADVYAAGEKPVPGYDRHRLAEGLRAAGHRDVVELPSPEVLADIIAPLVGEGDYVVCLGAGSITHWARALPGQLAERGQKSAGRAAS